MPEKKTLRHVLPVKGERAGQLPYSVEITYKGPEAVQFWARAYLPAFVNRLKELRPYSYYWCLRTFTRRTDTNIKTTGPSTFDRVYLPLYGKKTILRRDTPRRELGETPVEESLNLRFGMPNRSGGGSIFRVSHHPTCDRVLQWRPHTDPAYCLAGLLLDEVHPGGSNLEGLNPSTSTRRGESSLSPRWMRPVGSWQSPPGRGGSLPIDTPICYGNE